MKKFRNTTLAMILASSLLLSFGVYADEETTEDTTVQTTEQTSEKRAAKEELKAARADLKGAKEERKVEREVFKNQQKARKDEAKANREAFKKDKSEMKEIFADVTDENKEELKTLREENKAAKNEIKEALKNKDLTLEEREALQAELKEINESYDGKVAELVSGSETATAFIEERKALREQNAAIRAEAKEARKEYRGGRDEKVEEYKEIFFGKLAQIIPKVHNDKLAQISEKIEAMVENIEGNEKITEEKKDILLAQVISLKEILDEELENRETEEEDLDIDSILED
jgi:hypothetical protein